MGVIRDQNGKVADYTQWVVVKDLNNVTMHYRTYDDLTIKTVTLVDVLIPVQQNLQLQNPTQDTRCSKNQGQNENLQTNALSSFEK